MWGAAPSMALVRRFCAEEGLVAKATTAEILGKDRRKHVVWARQRVFQRLRALGYSYPGIGRRMDRDHTTVLFGVRHELGVIPPPWVARAERILPVLTADPVAASRHRKVRAVVPPTASFTIKSDTKRMMSGRA